jgi:small subunit ribosomal protein S4
MGYPGKAKKLYDTPHHPWEKARIEEETELVKKYGLRNKKSVWRHASALRKFRSQARTLLGVMTQGHVIEGSHYTVESEQIVAKLKGLGVLKEDSKLEDILALKVEDVMERRLQTLVFRKGFATSMKQARQFITHGHISINGRKNTIPAYMVLKNEEDTISYYIGSPITKESIAKKPVPVAKPAPKAAAPAAVAAPVAEPVKTVAVEQPKGE